MDIVFGILAVLIYWLGYGMGYEKGVSLKKMDKKCSPHIWEHYTKNLKKCVNCGLIIRRKGETNE